ncbi:MAG: purine-nucleoside phosphorylase [Bacilli bacterium]|nr:purine-nucleoside phosphorylase [Bacilli bacterium]
MSIHINAKPGDFAKVVLMPGDPRRAEWIAKTFFKNYRLVNDVRGMTAYTGELEDGTPVSVFPSGMGIPSIGIYAHELYNEYGVELIIRVGTCGAYQEGIDLKDIIIGQGACCDTAILNSYNFQNATYSAIADYDALVSSVNAAKARGYNYHVGNMLSSNVFYNGDPNTWKKWANMGVLGVEMEAYGLYWAAAEAKKKALAICSVSDSFCFSKILSQMERQESLNNMIEVALQVVRDFNK